MPNDIPYIQAVVDQYNDKIFTKTTAEVNYSIIETDDVLTLLSEGTKDLEDAKRDIEALMRQVSYGRVHSGAHDGIPQVIDAEWDNLPHPTTNKIIRLIGHSLGAMEASLMGCELLQRGYHNLEVITFGCPLWGDAQAVAYLNQIPNRTYQNYNNLFEHDLFTTIPLHLIDEPYIAPANRIVGWSAPTATNEWKDEGILIEAHSAEDCYLPLVTKLCASF